ncbi:hypothetical protein Taro_004037, partial [Colocasia esculenta]|nr:hypothetical protein [Colocasia esculenta]
LQTMHRQIQKEREDQGVGVHFLMIDSINAFYWTDRTSQPLPPMGCNRRNFSFQCITESIVLEINKLLKVESVLVLAAKATILGFEPTRNEARRSPPLLAPSFWGRICRRAKLWPGGQAADVLGCWFRGGWPPLTYQGVRRRGDGGLRTGDRRTRRGAERTGASSASSSADGGEAARPPLRCPERTLALSGDQECPA